MLDGSVDYDILILATGATHAYFGHDDWAEHAPGLKSLKDALRIRQRVLMAFEVAERETDDSRRRAWMTFVIVGAGPTGVELAGTLAEVTRQTLARDFRHINTASARVILVEASPRVLGAYTEDLSEAARQQLEKLGVTVWTGVQVTGIDAEGVWIGRERIHAHTVIWAAGVAASPLARTLGVPLDRAGRVMVEPELTIPGHDDVYVIGDLAHVEHDGALVPGVAPAAMQEGWHAASNIMRTLRGQPRLPFRYVDKGMLATIGRGAAVAKIGPIKAIGPLRLAALAVRPHPLPDRISQPSPGHDPVGVVVRHVRPRRPADHRAAQGAARRIEQHKKSVRNLFLWPETACGNPARRPRSFADRLLTIRGALRYPLLLFTLEGPIHE